MNLRLKQFNNLICILFLIALSSCEEREVDSQLKQARKLSQSKPTEAFDEYAKIIQVRKQEPIAIKAAIEASTLCLKNKECGEKEVFFLKFITNNSLEEKEQIEAQKRLAEYYYDKGFYPQAIQEMNRLLSKGNFKEGRPEIKIKLAKSNFYIKNFYQAEVELNAYIKEANADSQKFEGYLLRADIQSANKKYNEAMATYKDIKDKFPDFYFKNHVYLNEVLLLEEQKLLDQAISLLEGIKDDVANAEPIEGRIERLKERRALMPGAEGKLRR